MEDYREIILDRRTKVIKDDNHIFIAYKMMRKIPYRSCIGIMRYHWVEVSRVYSGTVMEKYDMYRRLDPNTTYGDVLVRILNERCSKNMRERRLLTKEHNLLNPKLWQ